MRSKHVPFNLHSADMTEIKTAESYTRLFPESREAQSATNYKTPPCFHFAQRESTVLLERQGCFRDSPNVVPSETEVTGGQNLTKYETISTEKREHKLKKIKRINLKTERKINRFLLKIMAMSEANGDSMKKIPEDIRYKRLHYASSQETDNLHFHIDESSHNVKKDAMSIPNQFPLHKEITEEKLVVKLIERQAHLLTLLEKGALCTHLSYISTSTLFPKTLFKNIVPYPEIIRALEGYKRTAKRLLNYWRNMLGLEVQQYVEG